MPSQPGQPMQTDKCHSWLTLLTSYYHHRFGPAARLAQDAYPTYTDLLVTYLTDSGRRTARYRQLPHTYIAVFVANWRGINSVIIIANINTNTGWEVMAGEMVLIP